ncbi:AtzG-like protein [uncultured Methylobacterium sp.]|uniref:AtzG-like protein n=1 Tax=uncultured Methylobacterium sp. TaxID=157278 RepID=UPI0035CBED9E
MAEPTVTDPGEGRAVASADPRWDPPAYAAVAAPLLGLVLDPAWIDPIAANLRVLAAAAALIDGFVLPDEAEAAPVFGA